MSAEEQGDPGAGEHRSGEHRPGLDALGQVPDQAGSPARESLSGRVPGQAAAGQGGVTPEAFVAARRNEPSAARVVVPAPADPVDGERPPSDAELTARVRDGDDTAYEEIYRRHADAVRRYARTCCRDSFTAEDLAGEVFARTLQALKAGKGPEFAVRAYLLTAVRNVAAAWGRSDRREQLVDDFAAFAQTSAATVEYDLADPGADAWALALADQRMVMQAYAELPEDDRMVLWHTEVERESPKTVAVLLGKTANATAVQAHRARDRLAAAFLQAHISGSQESGCAAYANRLGAYARGSLRKRASTEVGRHIQECDRCTAAYLELVDINHSLRAVLPGGVLLWVGAGYFTAAAAAVGAGAVVGGAVAGGAGASAGTAAGAGAGAGGAGGSGSSAAAVAGQGMGAVAKAGIAAGVAVAVAAVAAYALTGSPDPAPVAAPPASSAPADPPSSPPSPPPPSAAPSPEPSTTPSPSPAPPRVVPRAVPAPTRTPTPSATPTTRPPVPTPSAPAPPVPTPTVTPPEPPVVDVPSPFWLDELPFAGGGEDDGGGDGQRHGRRTPTIRGRGHVVQRSGLWMRGTYYRHALAVQVPSTVRIDLNRSCTSFDAVAGLDDLTVRIGQVVFSVQGDNGETLWSSGRVRAGDRPVPVHASLAGQHSIRLVVRPAAGGLGLIDVADWAAARLSC
ncbi:sigma-70 family RNA polymerase sigma factor [Kitasatospora cinereorecta]|uniref:Sigma-70 family RNA polymerase sigma factor n=1 Tax=Kitasatospora cinereorecta TaxID=285560 RepID=A0ABW0VJV7_9ACTN